MNEYIYVLGAVFSPLFIYLVISLNKFPSMTSSETETNNKNKVVIITGCDSGAGLELGKHVLEWGFYLVACCLDVESSGARLLRSLKADIVQLDVCESLLVTELENKIAKLSQEGKVIWCLVNNAGIMTFAKAEWLTWDLIQSQILVNLGGTIQLSRSLVPHLRKYQGRIINISSPQGMIASPYMSVYCASKFGVEAFSQALRRETANLGLHIIVVRPCNFPHKTSILKRNSEYLKKMKSEMRHESLIEYGDEIDMLKIQFEENFHKGEKEEQDIQDPYLLHAFRQALESPSPSRSYTAAPLRVRLIFAVFALLPDAVLDKLISWDLHTKVLNWAKIK